MIDEGYQPFNDIPVNHSPTSSAEKSLISLRPIFAWIGLDDLRLLLRDYACGFHRQKAMC